MNRKFCPYCGLLHRDTARRCARCGKERPNPLPRLYWIVGTLVLTIALSIALAAGISNYRDVLLKSFRPARCTILSAKMHVTEQRSQSDNNNSSSDDVTYSYSPYFTYTVSLPNGSSIEESGYSVPGESSYSSEEEVNAILKRYQVHHSYDCWYSPVALRPSGLVLESDANNNAFFAALLTVLFLPIATFLFCTHVYKTRRLQLYGRRAQGKILDRKIRLWGNQTHVEFHTEMYPEIIFKPAIPGWVWGDFKGQNMFALLYDPLDPQHNGREDDGKLSRVLQRWTIGLSLAACVFIIIILAIWFF